jgi:hypothetical protein
LNNIDILYDVNPDIVFCDGFDEAIIGFVEIFSKTIALYDKQKCIDILINRDGMTEEEAIEFFEYNVTGSYVGEYTPAFATLINL